MSDNPVPQLVEEYPADAPRALTPANRNPWYVLMTLHGEQKAEGPIDHLLHAKNRKAWNAWACQGTSLEEREMAAKTAHVSLSELSAWATIRAEVESLHKKEWLRRNGTEIAYPGLPNSSDEINLEGVWFERILCMNSAVISQMTLWANSQFDAQVALFNAVFLKSLILAATFKSEATFGQAVFHEDVFLDLATFEGEANFAGVNFCGTVSFERVKFRKNAWFSRTVFDQAASFDQSAFAADVSFSEARFQQDASFVMTSFKDAAWFTRAQFAGFSDFNDAVFGSKAEDQRVLFVDCQFFKATSFRGAYFNATYPDFSGAILNDNTTFSDHHDHWPKGLQADRQQAKASCAAIRHNLGKQGLPEAEHFFFRREMGFAAQIGGWWERLPYRVFGALSDFGYSIERPAWSLWWVWYVPTLVFAGFFVTGNPAADVVHFLRAGGISFANLAPVFSLDKLWFASSPVAAMPLVLKALAGAQAVVSLPLLFLFALGLRTRFRMR